MRAAVFGLSAVAAVGLATAAWAGFLESDKKEAALDSVDTTISAVAPKLQSIAGNYQSAPTVDQAASAVDGCLRPARARAGNLGDLSNAEIGEMRDCVAGALANMLDKMRRLKALQTNAAFDYAVFAETARLLSDAQAPARTAIEPFVSMLSAARQAAAHQSEVKLLDAMVPLGETIQNGLVPGA